MMKKQLVAGLVALFLVAPVLADKSEWTGEGKPAAGQKNTHKEAMKSQADYADENRYLSKEKEKKDKHSKEKKEKSNQGDDYDELKGLDKQALKKSEQERKELGKGSETGQESREGSSKWWKFWE